MDQIVQFNQEDMDVVVQPSIGWQDLNEQLNKMGSGLFFPVDPGESSLISRTSSAQIWNDPESTVPSEDTPNHVTIRLIKRARSECKDRRHDRDELFWHQCR